MKPVALNSLVTFTRGQLLRGDGEQLVTNVSTDSRQVAKGDVFVALVGERFDAHDFLPQVAAQGAAAVVVSCKLAGWEELPCAVIEVADTLVALQDMARGYRCLHNPLVIGITGSNGKTSTKDLTCAVMSAAHQVSATVGNLNNHIGCPLSVLSLKEGDTCGVFEMGMNHPGEIAPLAAITQPDIAIITNVGMAHIENMGSQEAIALEKGMLAEAVREGNAVILNANDKFSASIAARCKAQVVLAGIDAGQVYATELSPTAEGTAFTLRFPAGRSVQTFLPLPGAHMVGNAVLAAAAAWHSGIDVAHIGEALRRVKITHGRLETKRLGGVTFLDDSYNANPDSMKAGLKTLAELACTGRRVAVLGRMGELGDHTESEHRSVGAYVAELGLNALFTVGVNEAQLIYTHATAVRERQHFTTHADCASYLGTWLNEGDLVLLKGSRSARMEEVLTHLPAPYHS
jgi:UDP-N-acetylmuramoyl-tripeptide--D-alanyl-D-alanine ligase